MMRLLSIFFLSCWVHVTWAGEAFYQEKVKPLLKERCYSCHGVLQQKGKLRLDSVELMKEGGALDSGNLLESELFKRLTSTDEDERMPQEGAAFKEEEIALIKAWLEMGAPHPVDEKAERAPEEHWAFQAIQRPAIPGDGEAHPVDAFLAGHHERLGLLPQPREEAGLLVRRLHLDLTGLLPGNEWLGVENLSDAEWGRLVDELLADPAHGERWGRHWMDVWRYSDWYGLNKQLRFSSKHLWHWRDWIIESLNEDKGYDRMILEMLAGDELEPDNPEVVRATGYLARNYYLFNRTTWLDSTIEHTSKAFLGLTMNCAKCHDHKYDPLSHEDYYRMRAVFEPHQIRLDSVGGELDFEKDGLPRAFDDHVDEKTWIHVRGDEKQPDKTRPIQPGVPAILDRHGFEVKAVELPVEAYAPGAREAVLSSHLAQAVKRRDDSAKRLEDLESKEETKPVKKRNEGFFLQVDASSRESLEKDWEVNGSQWRLKEGGIHLEQVGTDHFIRSRRNVEGDFRAVMHFTTSGGNKWRSVGLRFDLRNGGAESHTVYASAVEGGQKVQVSHNVKGRSSYPADGRKSMTVSLNAEHILDVRVQGRLLNVYFDRELVIVYPLPERNPGHLEAFFFDATGVLHSLEVEGLQGTLASKLDGKVVDLLGATEEDRLARVGLARAGLSAAQAHLAMVEAKVEAERARRSGSGGSDLEAAFEKAAEADRAYQVETGRVNVLKLEGDLAKANGKDEKKAKDLTSKLKAARKHLEDLEDGRTKVPYEPLKGSLKSPETPEHKQGDYPDVYSGRSTGRRLALARWMIDERNPLTARVAVNHVWMRHFGEPLVETVFDFGRRAPEPELLDLLDWLASELISSGWSMKHLHRILCTSDAYRRTSSAAGAMSVNMEKDPANHYYWRAHSRRMESQVVRDVVLQLSGSLDRQLGGPSLVAAEEDGRGRRSLYFKHSRDDQHAFLTLFDDADIHQCYRRSESVVPQQALALSNSKLALEASARIRDRFVGNVEQRNKAEAQVRKLFQILLGRDVQDEEKKACLDFLSQLREAAAANGSGDPEADAWERLVHALLNHNDFVTIR